MGIRPEDISLENKAEFAIRINVELIENLGSEKIIYSHFNNTEIRIKTAKNIKSKSAEIINFKVIKGDKKDDWSV